MKTGYQKATQVGKELITTGSRVGQTLINTGGSLNSLQSELITYLRKNDLKWNFTPFFQIYFLKS